MENTENRSSKKLIIFEITCVLIIIALIGYTYSYFNVSVTNDTTISGRVASLSLTLNVSRVAPSNTNGLIPQLDQYITSAVIGRNGSCIDDNNNNVCQVYQIKVKNTSSVSLYANGTVALNANNNPNLKWAQISGTTSPTLVSGVNTPSTITLVQNELFTASEEKIYYIVVWISETGEAQYDTGSFGGTVTFTDAARQSEETETSNERTSEEMLTNLGLTISTGTPNFSKTSCSSGCNEKTVGIYAAEDDLGTSYYFRGDVSNNYVKFAGFYWRIIRINGNGSIRLIYNGNISTIDGAGKETILANGYDDSSTNYTNIGSSSFNLTANNILYVGYTYESGGNTIQSAIKSTLDEWFTDNLSDYSEYFDSNVGFCNDQTLGANQSLMTIYSGYDRLLSSPHSPSLKCINEDYLYTINDSLNGNNNLFHPIGTITADEVSFAGSIFSVGAQSGINYLFTGYSYWTITPALFAGNSTIFNVEAGRNLNYNVVSNELKIRPVINVRSNVSVNGLGTIASPYVIST